MTADSRWTLVVNHPKTFLPADRRRPDEQTSGVETQADAGVVLRVIEGGVAGRAASERRRLARWSATWAPSARALARIEHLVARAS